MDASEAIRQQIRKDEEEDYAKDAYDVIDGIKGDTGFVAGQLFDGAYEILKQAADLAQEELEQRVGGPIPHAQGPAELPVVYSNSAYPKSSAFSRAVSDEEAGLSTEDLEKIEPAG